MILMVSAVCVIIGGQNLAREYGYSTAVAGCFRNGLNV